MSRNASVRLDPTEILDFEAEISCECMLCHLPPGAEHDPVEWRLTWTWPGPYPLPGTNTMLMCAVCYRDWIENPNDFSGDFTAAHLV